MVTELYVQKVLYSQVFMFRRSFVQKVLCSEGPMLRNICLEGLMFKKYR